MFAHRGYHAARVDDVVRAARTSHGTFYLYFANKEDLLRALAVDCAHRLTDLAADVGPIGPDRDGRDELHRFLSRFLDTYRHYGPVIRAWMEDQVGDRHVDRLGVRAFTAIGDRLALRMREGGQLAAAGSAPRSGPSWPCSSASATAFPRAASRPTTPPSTRSPPSCTAASSAPRRRPSRPRRADPADRRRPAGTHPLLVRYGYLQSSDVPDPFPTCPIGSFT